MDNVTTQPEEGSSLPQFEAKTTETQNQNQVIIAIVAVALAFLVVTALIATVLLLPSTNTEKIADVFIIFLALFLLILGLVLVVLIIQLARLINLLQNEIIPILDSTNETVNTIRGTSAFLSENLVEPVMKMNEYMAGIMKMFTLIGLTRGRQKKSKNNLGE